MDSYAKEVSFCSKGMFGSFLGSSRFVFMRFISIKKKEVSQLKPLKKIIISKGKDHLPGNSLWPFWDGQATLSKVK